MNALRMRKIPSRRCVPAAVAKIDIVHHVDCQTQQVKQKNASTQSAEPAQRQEHPQIENDYWGDDTHVATTRRV